MVDAATLVATVGSGEVTPIHLIRYVEKIVFEYRALLPANTLASCGGFPLRSLAEAYYNVAMQSNSNTLLYVTSFAQTFSKPNEPRSMTYRVSNYYRRNFLSVSKQLYLKRLRKLLSSIHR